ncbi:hypothetical protein P171DRAFT_346221 [Karstenula rhodostoma CBS 690.94]|uniref:Zn(2)-C6 fungal-type domain-containing protein n=1 Tax=Karstenula rhodostoma CBS 690.94 TaxID=1392251 RepID=A0A9P4PVX7_9PLEO|nr:hypothetical protein P171DRAFT_346221 [Karstenula rhodostoma CBS 690.94]
MMSTSLHQYEQFPPPMQHQHHFAAQHMGASQYALQFHQNRHVLPPGKGLVKPHRLPYANGPLAAAPRSQRDAMLHERAGRGASASGPVRRRISRACDQCNQLRTKCDGKAPCAHCIEFGLTCEYMRERKKRGKASRKDLAAAAAAATNGTAPPSGESTSGSPQSRGTGYPDDQKESSPAAELPEGQRPLPDLPPPNLPQPVRSASIATTRDMDSTAMFPGVNPVSRTMSMSAIDSIPEDQMGESMHHPMQPPRIQTQGLPMHSHSIPEYASMDDFNRAYQQPHQMMHSIIPSNMPEYAQSPYEMMSPQSAQGPPNSFRMPHAESPLPGYITTSPVSGSPSWLSLPSPSATIYPNAHPSSSQQLRYPVLAPLVPHLTTVMPVSLACDLLELYFQSSSTAFMQPTSPYVLCYVFRKESFLRHNAPRVCSPALLASMLWIGCLTSESPYLASSPSARSQLSEKLINLTISLLKPLVHQSQVEDASPTFSSGETMNNFGISTQDPEIGLPGEGMWQRSYAASSAGAPGGIDDVCTYANLAVVISASEYKAASLRWWNAAWSLARELKLSKEVPLTPPPEENPQARSDLESERVGGPSSGQNASANLTEEQREERRRVWWMLYTVDRHLALCYNRPLSLLDIECSDLQTPVSDDVWQSPALFGNSAQSFSDPTVRRSTGPIYECTGTSTFGFFLPLMSILGEIVEVHHARNHPRFGSKTNWDDHAAEITRQLEVFDHSLRELKARAIADANAEIQEPIHPGTPSARSVNSTTTRAQESLMRARIVVAYGTHIMHTLHILLNGKWDPISLLDDNDLWISSQSFIDATGHAVAAAEALNEILELDPDLSFMPFFFGIYLLQGSFLLLLIADKLQGEANPNVVKACETIVRAHEACIVTLNTEYQRNFRKVMRSALQQVRGRGMDENAEFAQLRRREMLSLYRWSGDGTGLAL